MIQTLAIALATTMILGQTESDVGPGYVHLKYFPASNGWMVKSVVTNAEGEVSELKTLKDTSGETPKVTVVDGPVPQTIVAERLP
jgi:hypothetical protein